VAALLLGTATRIFCIPLPITLPWTTAPPFAAGMLSGSLAEPHAAASSTSASTLNDLVGICMVSSVVSEDLGIRIQALNYFILTEESSPLG